MHPRLSSIGATYTPSLCAGSHYRTCFSHLNETSRKETLEMKLQEESRYHMCLLDRRAAKQRTGYQAASPHFSLLIGRAIARSNCATDGTRCSRWACHRCVRGEMCNGWARGPFSQVRLVSCSLSKYAPRAAAKSAESVSTISVKHRMYWRPVVTL